MLSRIDSAARRVRQRGLSTCFARSAAATGSALVLASACASHARANIVSFTATFGVPNVLDFSLVDNGTSSVSASQTISLEAGPSLFDPAWGTLSYAQFEIHSTGLYNWELNEAAAN